MNSKTTDAQTKKLDDLLLDDLYSALAKYLTVEIKKFFNDLTVEQSTTIVKGMVNEIFYRIKHNLDTLKLVADLHNEIKKEEKNAESHHQ